MKANTQGRLDMALLAIAERLTEAHLKPRIGGALVWPVLKPLAHEGIKRLGVTRKNLLDTPLGKAVAAAFESRTRESYQEGVR
jgi:hypothetical protein